MMTNLMFFLRCIKQRRIDWLRFYHREQMENYGLAYLFGIRHFKGKRI